jgi:hypothetical protein
LDFYIDRDGRIANEFYRIDQEGNLIKIETGIQPLTDRNAIEKAFKTYFLKYWIILIILTYNKMKGGFFKQESNESVDNRT